MARPRARSATQLESTLRGITDEFVRKVAEAVQAEFIRELQARFSGFTQSIAVSKDVSVNRPYRVCPVPGCGKAGAGPRYGWFCKEHASQLSDSEKAQFRKGARAKSSSAKAAKEAAPAKESRSRAKKRGRGKPVDTDQVKRLKEKGMSLSQIAGELGISKTSVVRHLKKK
jgi:hypothetical protein